MWRSYFMTFTGPLAKLEAHGHADSHGGDAHGHGHAATATPHEQPAVITGVLVVLALGAVATSFIGLPALWTGRAPWLEHWLAPVFMSAEELPKRLDGDAAHSIEWLLMMCSVAVATLGLGLAWWMYRGRKSQVPARILARLPGLQRVVFNKYYVDEFYKATFVRAFMFISRVFSWFDGHIVDGLVNLVGWLARVVATIDGLIDTYLVDGAVNLVGNGVRGLGGQVRRLQTGRLPQYLAGVAAGAVILVVLTRFLIDVYS